MVTQADEWRGYLNQMLDGAPFHRRTIDDLATTLADELVGHRMFGHPVEDYHRAIVAGLNSGERLAADAAQDEQAVRDLLTRTLEELERRRPWPPAPFTVVDRAAWPDLDGFSTVGIVRLFRHEVQERLAAVLLATGGPEDDHALVLRVAGGGTMVVRAPASYRVSGVRLAAARPGDLAELASATGWKVEIPDGEEPDGTRASRG